jgi:hypothetical protein
MSKQCIGNQPFSGAGLEVTLQIGDTVPVSLIRRGIPQNGPFYLRFHSFGGRDAAHVYFEGKERYREVRNPEGFEELGSRSKGFGFSWNPVLVAFLGTKESGLVVIGYNAAKDREIRTKNGECAVLGQEARQILEAEAARWRDVIVRGPGLEAEDTTETTLCPSPCKCVRISRIRPNPRTFEGP